MEKINIIEEYTSIKELNDDMKYVFDRGITNYNKKCYKNAIHDFKAVVEKNDNVDAWKYLALTYYEFWDMSSRNQVQWSFVYVKTQQEENHLSFVYDLLTEAYYIFIVAMEYPQNKKDPDLLLMLSKLYLEFKSYDGILSVCTLLVSSYNSFPKLNEALFLSGIASKALGLHEESAGYFEYVLENPPFGLKSYFILLLAAREYEFSLNAKQKVHKLVVEAYKLMISRRANCESEFNAKHIEKTSFKGEVERIQEWFNDPSTWTSIASSLFQLNISTLTIDCYEQAQLRKECTKSQQYLEWGISHERMGDRSKAQKLLESGLRCNYFHLTTRYFLGEWVEEWKKHFIYEDYCATNIQRRHRGIMGRRVAKRRLAEKVEEDRNQAAIIIQCSFRCYLALQTLVKLQEIEKKRAQQEQLFMHQNDWLIRLKWLNKNARILQGFYLIIDAKNELLSLKEHHKKLIELLSLAFSNAALKLKVKIFKNWWYFWFDQSLKKDQAAKKIQFFSKSFLKRTHFRKIVVAKKRRQKLLLMSLGKASKLLMKETFKIWYKWYKNHFILKQRSALVIQHFYKSVKIRISYKKIIQKRRVMKDTMRRLLFSKQYHTFFCCFEGLKIFLILQRKLKRFQCVIIQKHYRAYLARTHVRRIRSRMTKCDMYVKIQLKKLNLSLMKWVCAEWKNYLKLVRIRQNDAAATIQALIRGWMERKQYQKRKDFHLVYRAKNQTLKYRLSCEVKRLIWVVLSEYSSVCFEEQDHAVKIIQRHIRGVFARKRFRVSLRKYRIKRMTAYHFRKSRFFTFKSFFNALNEMRQISKIRQNKAASRIQGVVRRRQMKKKLSIIILKRKKMELLAIKFKNGHNLKILRTFMVIIQNFVHLSQLEKETVVIRIQRIYRSRIEVKNAKRLVKKKKLQILMIQHSSSKSFAYYFDRWEKAIIYKYRAIIQSTRNTQTKKNSLYVSLKDVKKDVQANKHTKIMTSKSSKSMKEGRNWDQHFQVPDLSYYRLLNTTKKSGVCHLTPNHGLPKDQLLEIMKCTKAIILDNKHQDPPASDIVIDLIRKMVSCPINKVLFYNTSIDSERMENIARCLHTFNYNIISLVIGNTFIGNKGCLLLASALNYGNTKIEQLVLDYCKVGNAGGCALLESLHNNKTLWKLQLNGNRFSTPMCDSLGDLILNNGTLRVISLENCELTNKGVCCYLAPSLSRLTKYSNLETIRLYGNTELRSASVEELKKCFAMIERMLKSRSSNHSSSNKLFGARNSNETFTMPFEIGMDQMIIK